MFKKDKNKNTEINNEEELKNTGENPFTEESEQEREEPRETSEEPVAAEDCNELINKLSKAEEEKQIADSRYLRLAADFDNYRKRQENERESLLKYGAEDTVKKLFSVLDTFERAEKSFKEVDDIEKLKENFDVIQKQFSEALEKIGVEKIEAAGKEFDPNLHEAVMQTPSEEYPDRTIIAEMQSGYKLYDKILRPALVNVAVNE